jgi:uncharacterized protein YkwD/uncharacterized membrane protein required for colicin V production
MNGISWPDIVALLLIAWSAYRAISRGFVAVLMSLLGFAVSLMLAFALSPSLSGWLSSQFALSPIWSEPIAFLGIWFLVEVLFSLLERLLLERIGYNLQHSMGNRIAAVIPGAVQGAISAAIFFTALALLPVSGGVRNDVLNSAIGGRLVSATLAIERPFEDIFGPAAHQALGFLTIKPPTQETTGSEESVQLQFTVDNPPAVPPDEDGMLALVNQERTGRGFVALQMDDSLRAVARAHALDMFQRGYFAHVTPEGIDPFQRMDAAGIHYRTAGENLALAPTLQVAHDGLMNSPGHRANILNTQWIKVGIGVLDGGIYGKMFVQEFTD